MDVKTAISLLLECDPNAQLVVRGNVEEGYLDEPVGGIDNAVDIVVIDV